MKILIAGNVVKRSRDLTAPLKEMGHKAVRAGDGLQALAMLRKAPYDLVLAEVGLPVMTGLELCALLKADKRLKTLPIVCVSTPETYVENRKTAKSLGVQYVLVKPIEPTAMLELLAAVSKDRSDPDPGAKNAGSTGFLATWLAQRIEDKSGQCRLFQTAIEQAAELVLITDETGKIEYVNPATEKVTGYPGHELIGRNPRILKSGRQNPAFYQELWSTITRGNPWHGYFVNRRKDGTNYTEEAVIVPVSDGSGAIRHYVGVKRDVTQENRLQRQLIQSQKMEAIGTLAGGIAHDFNNILSAILGYAELALYDLPESSRSREDISEVVKAGNRAKDLVKQILTFSRKTEQEFKPVDVVPLIGEALKFLRASLPSTIEIRTDIGSETVQVLCNPTMVQQVLMNLCTNAAQAMKDEGGVLSIALQTVDLLGGKVGKDPNLKPGPYVRLSVGDSGPGIEPQILARIFDPYFTTKEKGEGTGLGLSVVHGIVQTLKGAVDVESRPGNGATFHVYLPCLTGREQAPEEPHEALPKGNEHILLADDEVALAMMGSLMLERLGYRVTVRTDAKEALKTFQAHPDEFDLVISDKTMPGMTGFELVEKIRALRPAIPVIICTGFSDRNEAERSARLGVSSLVMKPLSMDELAQAVRSALDNVATGI